MRPNIHYPLDAEIGEACRRAIEFGVDITLLVENLRLNPTERLRRAQRALEAIIAVREQSAALRARRGSEV